MTGRADVLLISCLGEQTGGGLFAYDGGVIEQLDTLSSTGLAVAEQQFGRLLWSSGEAGSPGELLVYDEVGVMRYVRIDDLREPHDLAWDGSSFVAVSTMSNSVVWLNPLKSSPDYEPLTRGMQAALPHVDHFLAGNSIASLEELADLLEGGLDE